MSDHLRCEWERRLTNQSTASPSDSRKQISNVTADVAEVVDDPSVNLPLDSFQKISPTGPEQSNLQLRTIIVIIIIVR